MSDFRIERDSLGEVKVPVDALYGAQTQRAVENFPISGIRFPRGFIGALGIIKASAAEVNGELGLLPAEIAAAIVQAAEEVAAGRWDDHFPLDIFQTGSGTSTNMNANEVIAALANRILEGRPDSARVHPNDHVNRSQSSNDVIPSAIHVAAALAVKEELLPALQRLAGTLQGHADRFSGIVKTGRTHLMDALPVTFGQEMGGWAVQVDEAAGMMSSCLPRLRKLAIGGTAVGTGVNAPSGFGAAVCTCIKKRTGIAFSEADNHFAAQSSMDAATETSCRLRAAATSLTKIANDLRLMNSGPLSGLAEISLPALQPGSSIMPGKVNPVGCEAVIMACTQIIGNDLAVAIGNSRGDFQLNVMLPLICHNLLQSITLLGNASMLLSERVLEGLVVDSDHARRIADRSAMLVTVLTPSIGYDKAAEIVRRASAEKRSVREVAGEMTDIPAAELDRLLDPLRLTGAKLSGEERSDP